MIDKYIDFCNEYDNNYSKSENKIITFFADHCYECLYHSGDGNYNERLKYNNNIIDAFYKTINNIQPQDEEVLTRYGFI